MAALSLLIVQISLCFQVIFCGELQHDKQLHEAIGKFLLQQASSRSDTNENVLALTRTVDIYPTPSPYLLPNVIIWDPFVQFPNIFTNDVKCPRCKDSVNFLKPVGWKDGRLRRHTPRTIFGKTGVVLVVSREYLCCKGHEVSAHHPEILEMFPLQSMIPFILSHKSGMTRELLEEIIAMIRNKLSFVQVHDIMTDRLQMRHLHAERRFLEDIEIYSVRHPVVYETWFPSFDGSRVCPSRNTITNFFLYHFDTQEKILVQRMNSLSTDNGWLSCDHTFKVATNIGYVRQEDKKWVKQFENLFCVLNEKGQVLTWQLSESQSFRSIEHLMKNLFNRLKSQEKNINEFYVDNCCQWRHMLQSIFGEHLQVKLDIFHAVQRVTSKLSKKHPFHWLCVQDLRMIFRDPTDQGETRTKLTPDSDTLISNAKSFLKKWSGMESNAGTPILSDAAMKEIWNVMEHMRKGCISGLLKNYTISEKHSN